MDLIQRLRRQKREIFRLRDKRTCLLIIIGKPKRAGWGDCLVKLYDNAAIRMTRTHVYNCCDCVSQVEASMVILVENNAGAFKKFCVFRHSRTSKQIVDVGNLTRRDVGAEKATGAFDGVFGPIGFVTQSASICHSVAH